MRFFFREAVALINADDASKRTAGVIQNFFDNGQVDAQPRHATCSSSSQVVQSPRRHVCRQQSIEAALVLRIPACRGGAGVREDERRLCIPWQSPKNGEGGFAEWDFVRLVVFRSGGR